MHTKLHIPRDRESHGVQLIGVKGTRKSTVIRSFVYQAYRRGMPCIFLDMKRDYLAEYYQEGRDWLIDFGDTRGVRWMTSREAVDEPHAMPMAEAAYPDAGSQHKHAFFFQDHTRAIFAYAVGTRHPTTTELAKWFANPAMLDDIVRGTEHAQTLTRNSPEQRAGILGHLNHFGRTLRWLPDEDGDREFSVTDWCKNRIGSVFLSSSPCTFPSLRPLHSTIADMLLLGLQTYPGAPVLFVGDEIGVFQKMPQLERSAAMIRSSGVVVVLAYQGHTQLEDAYGPEMADIISTNNYTNIVFRTTSPRSAKYASDLLGSHEVERIRESRSRGNLFFHRPHRSFQTERVTTPLILPGEIQSLPDGAGYMAQAGRVVKIKVEWTPPVIRAPRLLERIITPAPLPTAAAPRPSRYGRQAVLLP